MATSIKMADLLTVDEAATFLKVPKSWLYARTRTGEIPIRKLGRHVRIPADELQDWVDQQAGASWTSEQQ
jgi:excisionase family DNA binding protein